MLQRQQRTQSAVTRCGPSTAARTASSTLRWSSASRKVVSSSNSSTCRGVCEHHTRRRVREPHLRLLRERAGNRDALLLPAAERVHRPQGEPLRTTASAPQQQRMRRGSAPTCRPTAASAASTRVATSLGGSPRRPRPKATSAPADGMTTWWSGFWNTNARGAATLRRPPSGRSKPPQTRSSVDCSNGPASALRRGSV